jgi:hypothetical protein
MDELELKPNSIQVSEGHDFGVNGASTAYTQVQFFIGKHGPFVLRYAPQDAKPDTIKRDILKRQADLLSIHELGI